MDSGTPGVARVNTSDTHDAQKHSVSMDPVLLGVTHVNTSIGQTNCGIPGVTRVNTLIRYT